MKQLHPRFDMHSRFRNGIFMLALVVFGIAIGCRWFQTLPSIPQSFSVDEESQDQIDSLQCAILQEQEQQRRRTFNPNFISDYKGYRLGIPPEALDKLYAYRATGKWINSVADFQKVTGISDTLLKKISPLFRFPSWTQGIKKKKPSSQQFSKYPAKEKSDINTATAVLLQEEVGIPEYLAKRIINYRTRIGGFLDLIQLKDVYGLRTYQRKKIESLFVVKKTQAFQKIKVKTATVKELMEVPYFDFEMALRIVELVQQNQGVSDFTLFERIDGFSLEKIDRIALYLSFE